MDASFRPEPSVPPRGQDPSGRWPVILLVALLAGLIAGTAALVRSYEVAETTVSNESEFLWFWAGMFLIELPLIMMLTRRATAPSLRAALLVVYGLASYLPKLLRTPWAPVYHDEYAHWRETEEILASGKLFQPNPIITIIARYPGLHAATAALVQVTGLSIWQAAIVLLVLFHVTLVLGIAALAQSLGLGPRTAAIVAVLYGLNSSFLYFDTQFGYESMAITLVVWTLVGYVRVIRSPRGRGRTAWATLTVFFAAGTVVTHHLSTMTLVLIMALAALALSVPWLARSEDWAHTAMIAWSLTLLTALMAGAWFTFVAPTTWSYLSPFLGEGLTELIQAVRGGGSARQLFGASLSPWWEQRTAYLVPVFALTLVIGGALIIRAQVRGGRLPPGGRRALVFAFAALGLVYFPSTIFILSPAGAEGARRSWAFTWIGLCLLGGPAAIWLVSWADRRVRRWCRVSLRAALVAALAVTLVGGTAAGLDASYRFPGPFLYGSDARSVTPELLAASQWFSARYGVGNNIVTDRYTGLVFGSFGLQDPDAPSAGFPVWDLYAAKPGAPISQPDRLLLSDLQLSDYTYLIVDEDMAYELPQLKFYFSPSEPALLDRARDGKPLFYGRLQKFDLLDWMVKVFQSDSYSIYRLRLPVPTGQAEYQAKPPTSRGQVSQGKLTVTP
jgi:hypothetical protein